LSASVGHADLTKSNEKRQIRAATRLQPSSAPLCSRSLHGGTDTVPARAAVKTRLQKDYAVAVSACRQIKDI
jgi:hypothetical protein